MGNRSVNRSIMDRFTRRFCGILFCIMCVLLPAGCTAAPKEDPVPEAQEAQTDSASPEESGETLQVQILKVGKADAIILRCAGETMVIDCGEKEDGEEVLDHLREAGVQKIDVLMVTHFDKDHVGGADTVVEGISVDRVLIPAYTGSGKQYEEFVAVLKNAGIEAEEVKETLYLDLGAALVTVEPPASYEIPDDGEEHDNDLSLITTFEIGSRRLVFTGDIEEQRIEEWLAGGTAQPCDVLKVPHHGVYEAALEDLFAALQPEYAVICDSGKNPADDRTLELLKKCGAEVLETKDGDISIVCDGVNIELRQ